MLYISLIIMLFVTIGVSIDLIQYKLNPPPLFSEREEKRFIEIKNIKTRNIYEGVKK